MGSGVGVMFAIMVTAAVTLGDHGSVRVDTAQQAAQALRPLAGKLAGLLFAAGIVGTGLLAVPVLAGSTAYAIAETAGWHEGLARRVSQARAFYAVIAASILVGVVMDFVGVSPIRALYLAAMQWLGRATPAPADPAAGPLRRGAGSASVRAVLAASGWWGRRGDGRPVGARGPPLSTGRREPAGPAALSPGTGRG